MGLLDAALAYREKLNFSVIPVGQDKKPLIKWQEFQKRKASDIEIKIWWEKYPTANIGIVTGRISNLAVIDIDTEDGKTAIHGLIPDNILLPTCTTPKGGQHIYFRMPEQPIGNNTRVVPGCDLRAEGGYVVAPPSRNGNGRPYVWIVKPNKVEIPILPLAYINYINTTKNNSTSIKGGYKGGGILTFQEGNRDNDLFHVANLIAQGGGTKAEALQVLVNIANSWGEGHLLDWLEVKVESAFERKNDRSFNLAEEVRRYISISSGYISVTDCYKALYSLQGVTGVTKCDSLRTNIRQVFHRLKVAGELVADTKRDGYYRRVEEGVEAIEWENAVATPNDITWPMGIEDYFNTYPKNIAVIAGSPDAGKTAFLLNFAIKNAHKYDTHYFSSEMGAIELKSRIIKFEPDKQKLFKNVQFYERTSNFVDVIRPDAINIIDYIELLEDFWKVTLYIKEIFDRLNKGIAVIALQKKRGQQVAVGGEGSLQKPRLYMAMDAGRIQIIKAKNWAQDGVNPNNLVYNFKLLQGCHFIDADNHGWYKEN